MKKALSESWRRVDAETPPEGADPLLWELGQLRKIAQGALAHAAGTCNLSATASLLRSANGLLETVAKIEKAKAEEERVRATSRSIEDRQVIEDRLNRRLDQLAERMRQSQAVQRPQPDKPTEPGVH